ncbi:hypothetical protein MC885_008205 [Smutsia gigantea]|nr:hypothetical protein MC885_008205 [Smutsia gigantea]
MALRAPISPGQETGDQGGKLKKKMSRLAAEAEGIARRAAHASSLPLEAVRGTAGRRRAAVIPTAGAGRRSRRWLPGASTPAEEAQEAVREGGGTRPGNERGTAAVLGGGGGRNITHLAVRCADPSLGPPLAYVFPVPLRAQGRRRRAGDCRTVPGAGREPAELGEEPSRTRAEHAAPACSTRVHPSRRGGDRAETVAPGRCLGPDRLHVSPSRGHVHQLTPVRRPDVLRINKMKLGATGKQISPSPPNPCPRPRYLSAPVSRRSPSSARTELAGQVAASARPRPPAPPRRPGGALPQSLIKKVAKLTLPKVVVACVPPSQLPRNVLFNRTDQHAQSLPCACASPPPPRAGFLEQAASRRERERASKRREPAREREALADLLQKHKITPWRCAGPITGDWILPSSAMPLRGALPSATRRGKGRRGKDAPETRSSWGRCRRAGGAHPSGVAAREAAGPAASSAPHPCRGRRFFANNSLKATFTEGTRFALSTPPPGASALEDPRPRPRF